MKDNRSKNKSSDYQYSNSWRFPKPKSSIKLIYWEKYWRLALSIQKHRMASREKTIALERLEESYMWLVKSTEDEDETEET